MSNVTDAVVGDEVLARWRTTIEVAEKFGMGPLTLGSTEAYKLITEVIRLRREVLQVERLRTAGLAAVAEVQSWVDDRLQGTSDYDSACRHVEKLREPFDG